MSNIKILSAKSLSNENIKKYLRRFTLDTPKTGNLFNHFSEQLLISGWALPLELRSIKLVVQDEGLITRHDLTIDRPDVVKNVLANNPDSKLFLQCGFIIKLHTFSKSFKIGFEIDSTIQWAFEISYKPVYYAEKAEYHSLNGVAPVVFREKNAFILTGSRFTLMTGECGLFEESEYLWKDRWREYLATSSIRTSNYYSGLSIIAGNASKDNYYHWLFQVFPSLIFCMSILTENKAKIRVLGPVLNKFSRQYIDLLDNIEYVEVLDGSLVTTEEAIFSNILWGDFSFKPIKLIGDLLSRISLPNSQQSKRLYISRGDTNLRRVQNESEVINLVSKFGFIAVNLSDLSVPDQINIFRSAEAVAGPHGAGLTNLLFAKKGTPVVELMQDNYINECFKFISMGRELNYTSIINPTKVNGDDKHHDEMVVDLTLLEKALLNLKLKDLP